MAKLSPGLRSFLNGAEPGATIQCLLMLDTRNERTPRGRDHREEALKLRKSRAAPLVKKIDEVLLMHGGRRLSQEVDPFGNLRLETSAHALNTLAEADYVECIVEIAPIR